jgi:hypothetical protein
MKRFLLFTILWLVFSPVFSQNSLDILTISGRYGLPQPYENTYTEEATETGTFLGLLVPVPLSENTIWINSLNHFYFNVQGGNEIPSGIADPVKLNGFILRTGLYQKFDKGRGIQVLFAPRLMTDFNNVDKNHWQFGAILAYEKIFNERLGMSFGAMYNQELFGPYLVPIVNLDWQFAEKWSINGMLPVYAKVNYRAGENLTVGFSHFGLVTSYYLGDEQFQGDYIERQSIDLSLFARQKLAGNFYLEGRIGRSFGRKYEQYAGDQKVDFSLPLVGFGDERVAKNVVFKDGILIDVRLVFNIQVPE